MFLQLLKTFQVPTVPKIESTPTISDNPLDAPAAPLPGDVEEDREDEEMAGMDDAPKASGSPEKEDQPSSQQNNAAIDGQPAQTELSIANSARDHLIAQGKQSIILPSYSTWFDMHQIAPVEKKSLPEFFNSRNRSKTPAVYKDYRDFMINTYRLNPIEYLTVTACRRNLAGDVCAIMRVHAFLEQWGLINYQVPSPPDRPSRQSSNTSFQIDPETRPSAIGPPFTGHFRIQADTPRALQPFQPTFKPDLDRAGQIYHDKEISSNKRLNLSIGRNIYDQKSKEIPTDKSSETNGANATTKAIEDHEKESKKSIFCYSCGIDCTRMRYHYKKNNPSNTAGAPTKYVAYHLCPTCIQNHRMPQNHDIIDYVRQEDPNYSRIPDRDAPWSDKELLLLLEALEEDTDNWDKISDYVGTRTREECVVKFLQLEIEDKYLEVEPIYESFGLLDHQRIPFNQADNPVMSVVSFLAGMADPSVAAATAGRWVDETRRNLQRRLEGGMGGSESEIKNPNSVTATADDQKTTTSAPATAEEKGKAPEPTKPDPAPTTTAEAMDIDPSSSLTPPLAPTPTPTPTPTPAPLPTLALAASAARASSLASHEEREMTRLVSSAVNASLEKMELKMKQFAAMEALLQVERRELERGRRELFLEKVALRKRGEGVGMGERLGFERGDGGDGGRGGEVGGSGSGEGERGWRKFEM